MNPILFVAPGEDMYYSALRVAEKYDDVGVVLAYLDEGVKIAQENIMKGTEVIISRGGTLKRIEDSIQQCPTVEIQVTTYDIIQAIHRAKSIGKNICVIGFENIIKGVQDLGPILDINLETYLVNTKNEAEMAFERVMSKGSVDVIMGGSLAEKMAKENGIPTVYLETNPSTIENSIHQASHILRIKRQEMDKAERYKAILNNIREGIISIDKDEKIIIFNHSAERIIGIESEKVLGKDISEALKHNKISKILMSDNPEYGQVEVNKNKVVMVNKVPIEINDKFSGYVATFEDITKIQEYEELIRANVMKKGHYAKYNFNDIVGVSKSLNEIKDRAVKYSKFDSNILIVGETGTGKEVFAQSIHNISNRSKGPFVAVNCAAIPQSLIESEFFGYVGGSFTDARKEGKNGFFTLAHKGTLFLDEIGEVSIELQSRLLRVLQEKEVRPIGSDKVIPIDVRVIAATNKPLIDEVKSGKFRRDLFYRLNVLSLSMPNLRERLDDVETLSELFISKQNLLLGKKLHLSSCSYKILKTHHWPGNVRELQNVIERLSILYDGEITQYEIISVLDEYIGQSEDTENPLKSAEKEVLKKAIKECNGNKTEAARMLGISRSQLWRKLNN